jgi:hypothetical protein
MKYLLQADWERLVKNAERYEALLSLLQREGCDEAAAGFRFAGQNMSRALLEVHVDAELERQAEAARHTSGDSECKVCGKTYRQHPRGGPIGWGDEQFLNRLCDGSLVKL